MSISESKFKETIKWYQDEQRRITDKYFAEWDRQEDEAYKLNQKLTIALEALKKISYLSCGKFEVSEEAEIALEAYRQITGGEK